MILRIRRKWYNFVIRFERISRWYFLRSTVTSYSIHLLETGSWAGLVNSIGFRDRIPRNDRHCSDLFFHVEIISSNLFPSFFFFFFFIFFFFDFKKNDDKRIAPLFELRTYYMLLFLWNYFFFFYKKSDKNIK